MTKAPTRAQKLATLDATLLAVLSGGSARADVFFDGPDGQSYLAKCYRLNPNVPLRIDFVPQGKR